MNYEKVGEVLAAFEAEGVEYKVFGGAALNLQGIARATEDLDVFVAPDADNIARLRAALRRVFDDPSIEEISAEDLLGDYPAMQYVPPEGGFHLDILTRLGEAFDYAGLEAERLPLGDLRVTVATPRALFAMKRDTVRAVDRGDAERLQKKFDLDVP